MVRSGWEPRDIAGPLRESTVLHADFVVCRDAQSPMVHIRMMQEWRLLYDESRAQPSESRCKR